MALKPIALILCLHIAVYHVANRNSAYLQRMLNKFQIEFEIKIYAIVKNLG
jgi:hypothetical protein